MSEIICSFTIGSSNFDTITVETFTNEFCLSDSTDELWFDIADAKLLRETVENIQEGERLEPNWSNSKPIKVSKDSKCVLISLLLDNNALAIDNNSISEFVNDFRDYLDA